MKRREAIALTIAGILAAGFVVALAIQGRTLDQDYSNWSLSRGLPLEGLNSSSFVELNRTELEQENPYLLGLLDTARTELVAGIPDSRIGDLEAYLTAKADGKDWRDLAFEGYTYSISQSIP